MFNRKLYQRLGRKGDKMGKGLIILLFGGIGITGTLLVLTMMYQYVRRNMRTNWVFPLFLFFIIVVLIGSRGG